MHRSLAPFYFGAALSLASVVGCGAAEVRLRYGAEAALCAANERAIVDRTGTTEAEDLEALALERARCDAALRAAEAN